MQGRSRADRPLFSKGQTKMNYSGTAAFAQYDFKFSQGRTLIRFLAPLVVLLALPLAVIIFAFLLGGAAAIAITRAVCRLCARPRHRHSPRTIEADYVVLDDDGAMNARERR